MKRDRRRCQRHDMLRRVMASLFIWLNAACHQLRGGLFLINVSLAPRSTSALPAVKCVQGDEFYAQTTGDANRRGGRRRQRSTAAVEHVTPFFQFFFSTIQYKKRFGNYSAVCRDSVVLLVTSTCTRASSPRAIKSSLVLSQTHASGACSDCSALRSGHLRAQRRAPSGRTARLSAAGRPPPEVFLRLSARDALPAPRRIAIPPRGRAGHGCAFCGVAHARLFSKHGMGGRQRWAHASRRNCPRARARFRRSPHALTRRI